MIDPVSVAWLVVQDTPSVAGVFVIMEMMADDRPEMTRRVALIAEIVMSATNALTERQP